MPRKDYSKEIEERLQKYLELYEVENPNDIASLRAMCALELSMEKQQQALLSTDAVKYPKKIKDLQSAIRDNANSYAQLQKDLAIDRRKRKSEDDEQSIPEYIKKLQNIGKQFLASRLKELRCDKCGQLLAKYFVYVNSEGAEKGSINSESKPPVDYPFTIRCGCWKCEDVKKQDRNKQSHVAEISNEDIVVVEK